MDKCGQFRTNIDGCKNGIAGGLFRLCEGDIIKNNIIEILEIGQKIEKTNNF